MVTKLYGSVTAGLIVISGFVANNCVSRKLVGFLWRSRNVQCLVFSFILATVGIHPSEEKTTAVCNMLAASPRAAAICLNRHLLVEKSMLAAVCRFLAH